MADIYDSPLVIVDIGAAQPDHIRWKMFPNRTVIGFEPNVEEFAKLTSSTSIRFYNVAVDTHNGVRPLYVTGFWSNTSTLRPNMDLIQRLAYGCSDWEIVKTVNVECATLDATLGKEGIAPDFIKVDTQGSELSILEASPESLGAAFGLEIEVEFLPLYENQSLFEDVQRFMRAQGFQLMDLGNRLHVKGCNSVGIGGHKANFISADALYFRSLDTLAPRLSSWKAKQLNAAVAVCLAYGYTDYAVELCLIVQQHKTEASTHAGMLYRNLIEKTPISFKQRVKRSALVQWIGKKMYHLANHLVIDEQDGKNAFWFSGIGNR